jgi:hypothetical protein
MVRRMSREQREEAFVAAARQMYREMEAWYDEHETASFGEIEQELRQKRRRLMGRGQEILVNGRDQGVEVGRVLCGQCGEGMRFEGYRKRTVAGLEGESDLERAYYRCPHGCGESLFPPGPETKAAGGSVE